MIRRFLVATVRAFRPGPAGEVLLDASYVEHWESIWIERVLWSAAIGVGALSLLLREPLGVVAVAALGLGALATRWTHPERTVVFHEFLWVVETQPLLGREWGPWRLEYEWIDSFTWDGDRLNFWLTDSCPLGALALGVMIPDRHQRQASAILTDRRGKSRLELAHRDA